MSVDLIFKIAAIGILVAVLKQVLTQAGREDMATMTSLAGIIIVLLMLLDMVNNLFQSIKSMFSLY